MPVWTLAKRQLLPVGETNEPAPAVAHLVLGDAAPAERVGTRTPGADTPNH